MRLKELILSFRKHIHKNDIVIKTTNKVLDVTINRSIKGVIDVKDDSMMIRHKLRLPLLEIDRTIFRKTQREKRELKHMKLNSKK